MFKQALMVLGTALIVVGCNSSPQQTGTPSPNATAQDNMWMIDTAQANMMEIQEAKAALNESQNAGVKHFAQRMVDDHTEAEHQLSQLAASKGITLPTQLDNDHQNMVNTVEKMQGADFDRAYITDQVAAHENAITGTQHEADTGNDADVKEMAMHLLPTLHEHLSMAQQLQSSYPNTPSHWNGM